MANPTSRACAVSSGKVRNRTRLADLTSRAVWACPRPTRDFGHGRALPPHLGYQLIKDLRRPMTESLAWRGRKTQ